jgi:hypothetical protein
MFKSNLFIIVVKEVGNRFHRNFAIGLRTHPLLYRRANLFYQTKTQKEVKTRVVA